MNPSRHCAALVCAALFLAPVIGGRGAVFAQSPPASATIVDLGTLGGNQSMGYAVNNSGQVAGTSRLAGNQQTHAFLYGIGKNGRGKMTDLGTLGGPSSEAFGLNDKGEVVGDADVGGSPFYHAFLYTRGHMADLGSLGHMTSVAFAINNNGVAVGYSDLSSYVQGATLFAGGRRRSLASDSQRSYAYAINTHGAAVGFDDTSNFYPAAMLFKDKTTRTIGAERSIAYSVNLFGDAAGYQQTSSDAEHAFLFHLGQPSTDLGTLGGFQSSAYGINDSGQVVGASDTSGAKQPRAFVWQNGVMTNLNTLLPSCSGWTLQTARGISNTGCITGTGLHRGSTRAFLLQLPAGFAP